MDRGLRISNLILETISLRGRGQGAEIPMSSQWISFCWGFAGCFHSFSLFPSALFLKLLNPPCSQLHSVLSRVLQRHCVAHARVVEESLHSINVAFSRRGFVFDYLSGWGKPAQQKIHWNSTLGEDTSLMTCLDRKNCHNFLGRDSSLITCLDRVIKCNDCNVM